MRDGPMDGRTDGRTDRLTDGWTDRPTRLQRCEDASKNSAVPSYESESEKLKTSDLAVI